MTTDLQTAASACRARIAAAEKALTYAREKYQEEIAAQAIEPNSGSTSARDKRVADLATKRDDAEGRLARERDGLAGIMRAIEAEKQSAAELLAEAKRVAIHEALGRLDKQAAKVADAIRLAGEQASELIEIAREIGPVETDEGVTLNGVLEPLLTGMTIEIIRAQPLGSRFPNAHEVILRRNEKTDFGVRRAARIVRHRATGEPVDGDMEEAA
jgi:hypothetical protein